MKPDPEQHADESPAEDSPATGAPGADAPSGTPAGEEPAGEDQPGEDPAGEGPAGEGEAFWTPDTHDDTGLDLARAAARSIASAAVDAPRSRPSRKPSGAAAPGRGRGRGTGRRTSGAHPDERDPQALDTTLGRLVDDQGWGLDLRVHTVFGSWGAIVGDEVAQHCFPTSFEDGRLTVRTDSTAWATQLRLLAPAVVRRLNEELGHGSVTLIEVEGPNLPTWRKGRLRARDGRGPRDTYG